MQSWQRPISFNSGVLSSQRAGQRQRPACRHRRPKPKLLDQVRQAIGRGIIVTEQRRLTSIESNASSFSTTNGIRLEMAEPEIGQFLSSLATDRHVSASTQNQAFNALLFLYTEVLSRKIGLIESCRSRKETAQVAGGTHERRS